MLYESPNFRLEANDLVATLWLDLRARADQSLTLSLINEFSLLADRIATLTFLDALVIRSGRPDVFARGLEAAAWRGLESPNEIAAATLRGQELTRKIAELPMHTIAFIEGECESGGLEIALACASIVAVDRPATGFRPGFLDKGLIPCWGGSKRLPARLGRSITRAWLLQDQRLDAIEADRIDLADVLLTAAGAEIGLRRLLDRISESRSIRPSWLTRSFRAIRRGLPVRPTEFVRTPMTDCLDDLLASGQATLTECHVAERRAMGRLLGGEEGVRDRLAFAGEMESTRVSDPSVRPFRRVFRLGSGTHDSSMARTLHSHGIRVEALHADSEWTRQSLTRPNGESPELLLVSGEDPSEIRRSLAVCSGRLSPRTVIALTGQSITVREVCAGSQHPSQIIGMHQPAWSVTPGLVELSSGPASSPDALRRVESWLRGLGCVPMSATDRPGHVANTLWLAFLAEAVALVADGYSPGEVDRLALQLGFARAPLQWCDEAGFEEISTITAQLQLARRDDFARPLLFQKFRPHGWNGKSNNRGFYHHGFRRTENELARMVLWQDNERPSGAAYVNNLSTSLTEAGDRLIHRVINEAAWLAEDESIEMNQSADRVAVLSMGWPKSLPGPFKMADNTGFLRIINRLHELRLRHGERFRPASELLRRTEHGLPFTSEPGERELVSTGRRRLAG